jgi:microcin C transport system permease protein
MALSPLNRRRFERFKANRRGWWSLWLFIILFGLSLGAELIANDKPIAVRYDGEWYFPAFKRYPETTFGGEFPLEANYKSPYIRELLEKKDSWVLWAPIPFSYQSINYDLKVPAPAPPSADNWLGTDDQGRDVLSRVIYGFRVSVLFALTLTVLSSIVGVIAGALQGFYGGWVDLAGQRFLEIWSGLPVLYLLIILASFVQPNFWWLLGIMLLFSWMSLVDVVRAEFLRGRNLEYVRAARAVAHAQRRDHVPAHPAQRDDLDHDLHAVHSHRRDRHPDRAGLPRLRPARRLALAGRAGRPRQVQPASAVAGHQRLRRTGADAQPAGIHRRVRPRCLRPEEMT